jgi:hypothetical protein
MFYLMVSNSVELEQAQTPAVAHTFTPPLPKTHLKIL